MKISCSSHDASSSACVLLCLRHTLCALLPVKCIYFYHSHFPILFAGARPRLASFTKFSQKFISFYIFMASLCVAFSRSLFLSGSLSGSRLFLWFMNHLLNYASILGADKNTTKNRNWCGTNSTGPVQWLEARRESVPAMATTTKTAASVGAMCACVTTKTKLIDIIRILTGGDMKIKLKKRVRLIFSLLLLSLVLSLALRGLLTLFASAASPRFPFFFCSAEVSFTFFFGYRTRALGIGFSAFVSEGILGSKLAEPFVLAKLIPVLRAWWREIWMECRA